MSLAVHRKKLKVFLLFWNFLYLHWKAQHTEKKRKEIKLVNTLLNTQHARILHECNEEETHTYSYY